MDNKKAALIELGGSHDECLYSQLLFLKSGGYHTTLICSSDMKNRVEDFEAADTKLFFPMKDKGAFEKFSALYKIRKYIIKNNINKIIFNTCQGTEVRNLCLMSYPKNVQFYGSIHDIGKLTGSFTQNVINNRIKKYFVLNDYLVTNLKAIPTKNLVFCSYYPIFFPLYADTLLLKKGEDEIWIAIPGQVELKRRDYVTLIETLADMQPRPQIKFFLLGKSMHKHGDGEKIKQLVKEYQISDMFVIWDDFVANATYHKCIQNSDIVMPLIHPKNEGFQKYLNTQISGAYNTAFAYKKPLLMLSDFSQYEDFRENAIFYNIDTLSDVLMNLPQLIAEQQGRLYKNKKWSFDYQADSYLSFIN